MSFGLLSALSHNRDGINRGGTSASVEILVWSLRGAAESRFQHPNVSVVGARNGSLQSVCRIFAEHILFDLSENDLEALKCVRTKLFLNLLECLNMGGT